MKHIESSQQIYFTNEYAVFKMMNGNRQLNEKKINKIISEIQRGNDMLKYYPIQVRENGGRLDILDGQHRFYISKKLKRPVFYILVKEEKSMPDIAKINSNVEKWKPEDFINCYVQFGNENYLELQKFMDKYGMSLGVSLKLLDAGNPGAEGSSGDMNEEFRAGSFLVKQKEAAYKLADKCMMFADFPGWKRRSFIIAIYKIIKAGLYNIDDLASDFKKHPEYLTQQANYKAYINILEQMANIRKQKRVIIA